MPYYKATWQVYVRAKDESEAVEAADREREPGDCEVVEVTEAEARKEAPELFDGPWPSVAFIMRNGESWQGEGTLLDILDHFRADGLDLAHVIAIIPTQE